MIKEEEEMIIMKIRENQDKIITIERQQRELQSVTTTSISPQPGPVKHQLTVDAERHDSMKKKTLRANVFTESRIDEQDNLMEDPKSEPHLMEDQKTER